MKRLFLLLGLVYGLLACNSGPTKDVPEGQLSANIINAPRTANGIDANAVKGVPKLHFADTNYNFGWMGEGEQATHEFSFVNEGKSPLIISGATTTCGCTVPEFSREPIAPGKSGLLKVTFSSQGKWGHILKSIVVSSNAFPAVQVLTITADINPKK